MLRVLYVVDWDAATEAEATWKGLVAYLRVLGVEPQLAVWHHQDRFDPASFDVGAPIWPIRAGERGDEGRHELKRLSLELLPDYVHNTSFELNFLVWRACYRGSTWVIGSAERSVRHLRCRHGRLAMFLRSAFPNIQMCANQSASNDLIRSLPRKMWPWVHVAPLPVPECYFNGHSTEPHPPEHVLLCGADGWNGEASAEQQLADLLLSAGTPAKVTRVPSWPDPKSTHHLAHELHHLLKQSLCLVYAGDHDDGHFLIPKALASGIPVVAAASAEIGKMARNGVSGTLVDELTAQAASEVVSKWIAQPELRLQMGRAARKQAHEEYSAEAVASLYVDAYKLINTWKIKNGNRH